MRLFRVEVARVLSRRLVRVFGAIVVVGIVTGALIVFFKSHRIDNAAALARAQQARAAEVQDCAEHGSIVFGPNGEPAVQQSLAPEGLRAECDQRVPPAIEFVNDSSYNLVTLRDAMQGLSPIVIFIMLVIGASFIGAEWHARTVTTTLTWEPRRVRLMLTKTLAVGVVTFLAALAVQGLLAGSLVPVAIVRGTTAGTDHAWVFGLVRLGLRTSLVASAAAIFGLAIATLGRTTAAALGISLVYLAVIERIIAALRIGWRPWLLGENTGAFITGKPLVLPVQSGRAFGPGGGLAFGSDIVGRTVVAACWVMLAYVAGFVFLAAVALRREDVG